MARRVALELGDGTEAVTAAANSSSDVVSQDVTAISPARSGNDGGLATQGGNQHKAGNTAKVSQVVTAAPTPGNSKASDVPRPKTNPEGLEVLQLMAKGQALSSAVVVVEGVLHKMEEQASE